MIRALSTCGIISLTHNVLAHKALDQSMDAAERKGPDYLAIRYVSQEKMGPHGLKRSITGWAV